MENEYIRQIEINGIKVEVDLRTCKQISTYKIGDNVKVLRKEYSNYNVYSGVIIDFVNFKEKPALVVAYFVNAYDGVDVKFETITKETQDVEIAPCLPHELNINKDRVIDKFNLLIDKAKRAVDELEQKRDYFVNNFSKFFEKEE